ncbi:DUF2267 domain-containing protein [Micromonospora zingiberis]|uniref:DUF2267 domain-containing protein n=1 Tax=Micromonospora zingiberis TaxID=2053011 RepID=A0A4R0GRY4_9ACTN|nr:DUF2267 domain-containing protein [Micromonospora zingiberis]TCC00391.1 DUF2267 domain-containing protein [Micromonospora zingiberis]
MRFPLFVDAVSRRSGLPVELSAVVARAVLRTMAERMTGGPTTDPTGYLPDELSDAAGGAAYTAGPGDFLRRVGERAGVDEQTAGLGAAAVFATLREAVTVDEFRALVAGLPTAEDGTIAPITDETWP